MTVPMCHPCSAPHSPVGTGFFRKPWLPGAGVLASQPDLFFLSSALDLSGFGAQLPSPNLPVTVFAPTNSAILNLLSELSTHSSPCWLCHPSLLCRGATFHGPISIAMSFVCCECPGLIMQLTTSVVICHPRL